MAKRIMGALVALLVVLVVTSAYSAEKYFRWTKPGGDPCNPKVGCTLEWVLQKSGWPQEVQGHFLTMVRTTPTKFTVHSGWEGWMTWGKYKPKFEKHTVASWSKDHVEPALLWQKIHKGEVYNLIRVHVCGNWGGFVSGLPDARSVKEPEVVAKVEQYAPPSPDLIPPPGMSLVVACL